MDLETFDIERVYEASTRRPVTGQTWLNTCQMSREKRSRITIVLFITTILAASFTIYGVEKENFTINREILLNKLCCAQNRTLNDTSYTNDLLLNETRRVTNFTKALLTTHLQKFTSINNGTL